jgi:hypothetical protein
MPNQDYRIEKDSLGEVRVPTNALLWRKHNEPWRTSPSAASALAARLFGLWSDQVGGWGCHLGTGLDRWHYCKRMEDDKHMRLRLIVHGLEAEDLQITAMPSSFQGIFYGPVSITRDSHLLLAPTRRTSCVSPCPVLTVKHPEHICPQANRLF